MKVKGKYKDIKGSLPEEVRKMLDGRIPEDAEVDLTAVEIVVKDACSDMPCKGQCEKECPVETAVSLSDYVDCIDVELGSLVHTLDYVGVPVDKKKALASLKQINDAAQKAIKVLEGGK